MLIKISSIFLIVGMLCFPSGISVLGQSQQTSQQKQAEKVKTKIKKLGLGERVKVSVKLYGDATYKGYVSQANDEDFIVVDKTRNPNTVKYSDVRSIGGRNLSTGAKIGIGIGTGAAAVLIILAAIISAFES